MILETISSLELKAVYTIREEEKRINSIHKIKQYLSQIDFEKEDVPLINAVKFKNLLKSLKGAPLDIEEAEVAELILSNSNFK